MVVNQLPEGEPRIGSLCFFPHSEGGYVCGIINDYNLHTIWVWLDDITFDVPLKAAIQADQPDFNPSMGALVGKQFTSLDEIWQAVQPYRLNAAPSLDHQSTSP